MPYVTTNGTETYYERRGEGHSVVLIHGSGWDHRQWMPQLTTLADEYDLICYDVRGHGKTGESDRDVITAETLAEDLKSLVETLDVEDPTLVGLSMGGRIAHVCAASYPTLPGSLVTYEAPARLEPWSPSVPLRVLLSGYKTVYRYLGPVRAYQLQTWFRRTFGDLDETDSNPSVDGLGMTKEEYIRDALKQVDAEEQLKLMESLGEDVDTPSDVSVPTLVLTGEESDSINVEAAEQLSSEIPNARRGTIPDAGHAGNIDNSDAFNRRLREFISAVHPVESRPV